jgi:hypothetical protein
MKKKWHISRRKMLKGVGACIALPYLEAMSYPGFSSYDKVKAPVRSAFLFMPNGVHPDRWTPEKFGTNFELSPILSPLKGYFGIRRNDEQKRYCRRCRWSLCKDG